MLYMESVVFFEKLNKGFNKLIFRDEYAENNVINI